MSKLNVTIDYVIMAQCVKSIKHLLDKLIIHLDKAAIEASELDGERRINGPDRRTWMGRRGEDE